MHKTTCKNVSREKYVKYIDRTTCVDLEILLLVSHCHFCVAKGPFGGPVLALKGLYPNYVSRMSLRLTEGSIL